jgi:molybdopterin converting factor small subunit
MATDLRYTTNSMDMTIQSSDEVCPIHGLEYVAFDLDTGKALCNGCIYEGKYTNLVFNAEVAKNLTSVYDEKYKAYEKSLHSMQEIKKDLVTTKLQEEMGKFFAALRSNIDGIQEKVLGRLEKSQNLKEVEEILQRSKEFSNEEQANFFQMEKSRFDDQIERGKFAKI